MLRTSPLLNVLISKTKQQILAAALAFLYGSTATSSERSSSDIDLMVIGSVPLSTIAPAVRGLEREIGRAINPTVYSRDEFARQKQRKNHFLTSVLQEKALFIHGGPDELAELAASAQDKTTSAEPPGARRFARRR